jgi:hypothetical protein
MSIDNFWGENYYNHPPLTADMIQIAEERLGVKLPSSYLDLLRIQNGGYTQGFAFPMSQETTWAADHVPLTDLFGIIPDETIDTPQNIMLTSYMTDEWGLPAKQVLLTGDGHWWITLDYRDSAIPAVSWIDTECNEDIRIAETFDKFIEGLVSDEEFMAD